MKTQTTKKSTTENGRLPYKRIYLTREEGKKLLDKRSREVFGISGEEFIRKYRAGEMGGYEHADVMRVQMLIPLAE